MDTMNIEISNPNLRAAGQSTYVGGLPVEDRMRVLKALACSAGLRLPDTILPEGTALLPIGEQNKRRLQGEIEALPSFRDGMDALYAAIRAEQAVDVKAPVQRVRMDGRTGRLYGDGEDATRAIGYTDAGFNHVVSFLKPPSVRAGAADCLLALPNGIRADAFNHWAKSAARANGDDVVLRTLVNPASGTRIIRAVTSARHSLTTGDDGAILHVLGGMPELLRTARLRTTRTPDRTDLEVIWPAMERQIVVGDVVKVSLRITNSETKAGSLRVDAALLRVLCCNFTTAYTEDNGAEDITLRHVGDLRMRLPEAIKRALARVEPFVRAFGDAYKVALPEWAPTRGEILERVGAVYRLPETTLTAASELWDADGDRGAGDTLAGLSHALTRASQRLGMADAATVEAAAGRTIARGWAALQ